MRLFDQEKVLCRSDKDDVVLTTHRVRKGADSEFTSIMLDEVCSVRVTRISHPWLLYATLGAFAGAIYLGSHEYPAGSIFPTVIGTLALVAYFRSRVSVVEIASAAAIIQFRYLGASAEAISDFVMALESAKDQRYTLSTTRTLAPHLGHP